MKDEIKEIKRILATSGKYITYAERCYVLDYITNLQEENEELKNTIDFIDNKYKNTIKYNEKLIEYNQDYKSRIDKAIEHIKQYSNCSGSFIDDKFVIEKIDEIYNGTQLLNILTGGDEE